MKVSEYSTKMIINSSKLAIPPQALHTSGSGNGSKPTTGPTTGPTSRVVKRPQSNPNVSSSSSNATAGANAQEEVFHGYVAHPIEDLSSSTSYPLTPIVLVFATVRGVTKFEMQKAFELAQQGYTAIAVDLYGSKLPFEKRDDPSVIGYQFELMNELLANPYRLRGILNGWIDLALSLPSAKKDAGFAATGYCFGGTVCCELVRMGHPSLKGIVSFHGVPDALPMMDMTGKPAPPMLCSKPANNINPKVKVLVQTGRRDPMVPKEMVNRFEEELASAGVEDFSTLTFGGATHGFALPGVPGVDPNIVGHNQQAWVQGTHYMRSFLRACFNDKPANLFDLGRNANVAAHLAYKGSFNMGGSSATTKAKL